MRRSVAAAVALGAAVGLAARELPTRVALTVLPGGDVSCDDLGPVECSFEAIPTLFGAILQLALILIGISAVGMVAGIVALVVGLRRHDWLGLALVGGGTAGLVPIVWLAGSFVFFLAS